MKTRTRIAATVAAALLLAPALAACGDGDSKKCKKTNAVAAALEKPGGGSGGGGRGGGGSKGGGAKGGSKNKGGKNKTGDGTTGGGTTTTQNCKKGEKK